MTIRRVFLAGDAAAAASAANEEVLDWFTSRSPERGREGGAKGSGFRGAGDKRPRLLRRMGQTLAQPNGGGAAVKSETCAHGGLYGT